MGTYYIVRFFESPNVVNEIIKTNLTLEEAKEHCNDPETSHSTATSLDAVMRTRNFGKWFDGYEEERD